MKKVGNVLNLFILNEKTNIREIHEKLLLDEKGVIGDKFYGKKIERSILLISKDSYDLVTKNNIKLDDGSLGENILIDYNPYNLEFGTKLQIGETILELTKKGTLCNGLSQIDNSLPKLLKNGRGVFAKVIKSGEIKYKDLIYLLN